MLKVALILLRILVGALSLATFALCLLVIAVFGFFTSFGNALVPFAQLLRFFLHGLHDPGPDPHFSYLYLLPYALVAALNLAFFLSIFGKRRPIIHQAIAAAATCAAVWTLAKTSPIDPELFWPPVALWFTYYAVAFFSASQTQPLRSL